VNCGFAQVSATYGHAEAQIIVENCGNTLILRCSASENGGTARFASRPIGEREIAREHITTNDGGGFLSRGQATTSKSLQQSPNPQYCRRKSSSSPTFMVSSNSPPSQRGGE
jgi:type IV secretory pathway TraG/TraD family ATPase VirD4